jgi:pyruvate dehydrogenase E2 component (dihydrolipoyllysine-residue acetyltransferase)
VEVVVPDLGDFADVEIIEILVKPGDTVAAEQGLITLETEKATMDVPSPAAGRIGALKVRVGDRVSKGDVILSLTTDGGDEVKVSREPPKAAAKALPDDDKTVRQPKVVRDPGDRTVRQPKTPRGDRARPVTQPVVVPDLGDFADVEIIELLVKPGDEVAKEQALLTLETEKASMDVPAPLAGRVVELKVQVGGRVSKGDVLLLIEPSAAGEAAPAEASTAKPVERPAQPTSGAGATAPKPPSEVLDEANARAPQRDAKGSSAISSAPTSINEAHASPSVRKLARELGVDLGRVRGSGQKGRVTAEDVKAFVKEAMRGGERGEGVALPSLPTVDFAKFGPVETEPLSRIQRISGPRLHASWVNIPHVTQHDEADITEMEERRAALKETAQQRGIKLTPLAFIIRACALALAEMPLFKSSLAPDGQNLVMKRYTHIGFAADTPSGLVVPVIRDADKKDIYELAKALATLSERARTGKLQADDMQGGVFTVSSLGGIGGKFFTPIINAPEVAILGVSRSSWQPIYRDLAFVPRLILPLSLAYDHRVVDGANAVRFTTLLARTLADAGRLVEAIP